VVFNQGFAERKGSMRTSQGFRRWPSKSMKITAEIVHKHGANASQ